MVYESTEQRPDWKIQMRHAIVQQVPGGVQVMEILLVENPADRTWVGVQAHQGDERRSTLILGLPEGLKELELMEGVTQDYASFDGKLLFNYDPLVPGVTRYQYRYFLPAQGGRVTLPIKAPAPTQQMMVMVPSDGVTVRAEGLTLRGEKRMGQGATAMKAQSYGATDLKTDQVASLTIEGIADAPAAMGNMGGGGSGGGMSTPQVLGIVGVVAILSIGGTVVFLKKPAGAGDSQNQKK
jgi:hypothetical protein